MTPAGETLGVHVLGSINEVLCGDAPSWGLLLLIPVILLLYTITIFNRKGIPFYYKTLHPLKHVKTKNAFNFVIVIDH